MKDVPVVEVASIKPWHVKEQAALGPNDGWHKTGDFCTWYMFSIFVGPATIAALTRFKCRSDIHVFPSDCFDERRLPNPSRAGNDEEIGSNTMSSLSKLGNWSSSDQRFKLTALSRTFQLLRSTCCKQGLRKYAIHSWSAAKGLRERLALCFVVLGQWSPQINRGNVTELRQYSSPDVCLTRRFWLLVKDATGKSRKTKISSGHSWPLYRQSIQYLPMESSHHREVCVYYRTSTIQRNVWQLSQQHGRIIKKYHASNTAEGESTIPECRLA